MTTRIQMRRGTAAEWAAANPVLADGEAGFARDTGVFKVGDGVTAWNSLTSVYAMGTDLVAMDTRVDVLEADLGVGTRVRILADNAIAETATDSAWPTGISLMKITTGSGWSINNGFGYLVTFRIDGSRTRQQLYGHVSNDVWTRYFSSGVGTPWVRIATRLTATATLDFPSIPANSTTQLNVTVTGAVIGDTVSLAPPDSLAVGIIAMGRVIATDTVAVRLANVTTAAIDPVSATWGVSVSK